MPFDAVIQQALREVRRLLVANIAPTRDLRTVVCLHAVLGRASVRQALEKANYTASCFALREVKYVLDQRQQPKTTINRLWRIIEQLDCTSSIKTSLSDDPSEEATGALTSRFIDCSSEATGTCHVRAQLLQSFPDKNSAYR